MHGSEWSTVETWELNPGQLSGLVASPGSRLAISPLTIKCGRARNTAPCSVCSQSRALSNRCRLAYVLALRGQEGCVFKAVPDYTATLFDVRKGVVLRLGLAPGESGFFSKPGIREAQTSHPTCHRVGGRESCRPCVSPADSAVLCAPGRLHGALCHFSSSFLSTATSSGEGAAGRRVQPPQPCGGRLLRPGVPGPQENHGG